MTLDRKLGITCVALVLALSLVLPLAARAGGVPDRPIDQPGGSPNPGEFVGDPDTGQDIVVVTTGPGGAWLVWVPRSGLRAPATMFRPSRTKHSRSQSFVGSRTRHAH